LPRSGFSAAGPAVALAVAAGLLACGKTGPLRPPAPHGPLPAGGVTARQIGDRSEIALTVPSPRGTAGSQAVARTEIVRVGFPPGVTPQADPEAFRVRGEPVASVSAEHAKPGDRLAVADPSLSSLANGGLGWTLRYGVRVLDAKGRPSPLVVAPDLVMVPAVGPPRATTGEASAGGVRLTWEPPETGGGAGYNVYRGPIGGPLAEAPLNEQPLRSTDFLDETVTAGAAYRYVVRTVAVEGAPYHESVSSPEVHVDASDRFAPAPPTGLVVVQEGSAARLLWNPGTERDLDGYHVYRNLDGAGWTRLDPEIVRQPSFLDPGVPPGASARYRVTALDRAQPPNESAPSDEVEIQMAREPAAPVETP